MRVRSTSSHAPGAGRLLRRSLAAAALLLVAAGPCERLQEKVRREEVPPVPPSVQGTLRLAAYGETGGLGSAPLRHVTRWVNGVDYRGMEDNDLRGFLDGRFIYGWNQPGQIHVRAGRRPTSPRWGESELFRTLVRFADVALPAGARVHRAQIRFQVEEAPERPLDLLLYAVNKDWNPGGGGERGDNTSPPLPGEVWWGEVAHGERAWGFAGAGFASSDHPEADTPVEALAEAHLELDGAEVVFASAALDRYVEARARSGLPLLFLLKASDALEDLPGTLVQLYSGNHGDLRNPARRPELRVTWEAPREVARLERAVHLENGRVLALPRLATPGAGRVAVSFVPEPGHDAPTIRVRGGRGGEVSEWRSAALPVDARWDWVELRVRAARNPVVLGEAFETRLRDTWVRTAPPEEQDVRFTFVSPRGATREASARYTGDYTWEIRFEPDEIGRWRYAFEESFLRDPYHSAEGVFDVVGGDHESLRRALEALHERIRAVETDPSDAGISELAPAFWKLERAVFQAETPESMATEEGRVLFDLMTAIRHALSGRNVPDEARLKPMDREF